MPEESAESKLINRVITITFNDGSIFVATHVASWGTEDDTLYFREEVNPNRTTFVLAHSMKMYEVETLR